MSQLSMSSRCSSPYATISCHNTLLFYKYGVWHHGVPTVDVMLTLLLAEIDRCLKAIAERVEIFEDTWEKVCDPHSCS